MLDASSWIKTNRRPDPHPDFKPIQKCLLHSMG